jgi:glyoxylase-like metal-dependent hydrolase (beta-lactamase superfamily II)
MLDRRAFLATGIAGASALTLSSVWSQGAPDLGAPVLPQPGFKRMKMGDAEVIAFNDGAIRRPLGDEFVTNAPLEQVKALLASQGLPTTHVDIPFTPFLIVSGGQRVLIDSGFADNGPPTTGKLGSQMAAAGLSPAQVDAVILSHFHGDHINGLINKAGALVYPNARYFVPEPEFAFWMNEANMNAAPQAARGAYQNARRVMSALPADRLTRFAPGTPVVAGIESVAAFGHTPGHTLFTFKSGGQGFAYLADLTNVPSLFARNPDWSVTFDMDKEMARQTRRKMFDMVVKDKMVAGGFHFPFPAFGAIEVAGNGYQFKPMA